VAQTSDGAFESRVDRLYQLPLDQFVRARNELARQVDRAQAPAVRALPKPNVLAWSLNQLYWSKRSAFDRLVTAAARLRAAQANALLGKPSDLRAADAAHREAIRDALKEAAGILEGASHAATPDAIREMTGALEALPWREPPGRLAQPPRASGFEALAGLPMAPQAAPGPSAKATATRAGGRPGEGEDTQALRPAPRQGDPAIERRRREAALKEARASLAQARREETGTASRLGKAEARTDAARARERQARERLTEAERGVQAAERDVQLAERDRQSAAEALNAARAAARMAKRALAELEQG
jgi:hypothetical protein